MTGINDNQQINEDGSKNQSHASGRKTKLHRFDLTAHIDRTARGNLDFISARILFTSFPRPARSRSCTLAKYPELLNVVVANYACRLGTLDGCQIAKKLRHLPGVGPDRGTLERVHRINFVLRRHYLNSVADAVCGLSQKFGAV